MVYCLKDTLILIFNINRIHSYFKIIYTHTYIHKQIHLHTLTELVKFFIHLLHSSTNIHKGKHKFCQVSKGKQTHTTVHTNTYTLTYINTHTCKFILDSIDV